MLGSDRSVEGETPLTGHHHLRGVAVFVGSLQRDVAKSIVADSGHAHVGQVSLGEAFHEVEGHIDSWHGSERQAGAASDIGGHRERGSEGFGHLTVEERCDDQDPITSRHVGCERAVLIGGHVEPLVLGLVVEQELVRDAVIGVVGERSSHAVRVAQRHGEWRFGAIEGDVNLLKGNLPHKVVIRGVLITCCGSVEQQIVGTGRQVHRDVPCRVVIVSVEVERITAFIGRLQRKGGRDVGSVLKRLVFCRVQEDVQRHVDAIGHGREFHPRQVVRQ